ncbi:phosphatase PAP2/dual specificity phosphatase family protein [Budviciaceae bacterium CWB-B4]|uniref:Phosphatase PAP2/dual specificity phosphatase family protein n=1 Tax=Limnobaculum xujianqingii TaxID=2738837 RepID=A0A9D7FWQ3_9GAMM|nr:phosphatase PAP2/dual specificity phosphatase family protein [Limnobaculum xujianqingii]MBK5072391.1 phosphatase PAP2/dual specificity phosphatase family protein [Limnobaculum xujianqingii]MBK5175700.1 phosphatase PAP2/dual specificity phosphatase family protein [Limnobaculum xujianqingii]
MNQLTLNPDSRQQLWLRAGIWLLFLAPFFFLTYGQVNQFTATRDDVGVLAFSWESSIPFWPWTIVPYWSIDLLYGISLFICTSRRELMVHGLRLAVASVAACVGFLLFPLRFSFVRPVSDGMFGWLFQQLEMFDLPYNQAPSLHIILLWLLWLRFYPHTSSKWRWLLHSWFTLIGISVLTTWQHHFIDVITGLFVGVIISYALPVASRWRWQPSQDPFARRLAVYYYSAALVLTTLACWLGSGFWILIWPAISLLMVALGYSGLGSAIFQKNAAGNMSPSARLLLAPYQIGAWCSFRYFSAKYDRNNQITEGILLGSYPRHNVSVNAVLDMTSEWQRSTRIPAVAYIACPQLDLLAPSEEELQHSVQALNELYPHGQVLVHCALGLSRSAIVVAAWLLQQQRVTSVEEAEAMIRQARPKIIFRESHLNVLNCWAKRYLV